MPSFTNSRASCEHYNITYKYYSKTKCFSEKPEDYNHK